MMGFYEEETKESGQWKYYATLLVMATSHEYMCPISFPCHASVQGRVYSTGLNVPHIRIQATVVPYLVGGLEVSDFNAFLQTYFALNRKSHIGHYSLHLSIRLKNMHILQVIISLIRSLNV
jgi:hypothetical protein